MLVHSEVINPCKCGTKQKPNLDSDDMVPCWAVQCYKCGQFQNASNWSMQGAVNTWNKANPIKKENEK
jgi:hypothetical protein